MHNTDPNQEEFKQWYDQYFSFIYLFLKGYFFKRNIPLSEKELEDLVQNTFVAVLERKSGSPIEYPMAYLKQTAISQARQHLDKKMRQGYLVSLENIQDQAGMQKKLSNWERKEEEFRIQNLLNKILSQLESKVFFLRIIQGYSYKEIAAEDGMPNEPYLHTLYHRAKNKLQDHFKNLI